MSRLLLVSLLVFVVISLAGAFQEENGGNSITEKKTDLSEFAQRSNTEARRNTRRSTQKKKKKKRKNKNKAKRKNKNKSKSRKSKRRNRKRSKSLKKKKKRTGKKRGNKKNGKKRKNKKKGKKQRNKKRGNKRRNRKNKNKRKGRKNWASSVNSTSSSNSSSCGCTCLANAMKYLKMQKDKVANYLRQKARIEARNKTAGNKSGKKGLFGPALRRLADAGGGNKSNLSCAGSTTSAGAIQMKNISDFLKGCSKRIHAACNPSTLPVPSNLTKVAECNTAMTSFASKVASCVKLSGSSACSCWASSDFSKYAKVIQNCSLKTETDAMKTSMNLCKGNFSVCRKYEDDVVTAISSCAKTTNELLLQAQALTGNAAAPTCAAVIALNNEINKLVADDSASTDVATKAKQVSSSTASGCTTAEKATMKTQATSLGESLAQVKGDLSVVQKNLKTASGSTASSASIAAATTASSASVSTKSMRYRQRIKRGISW